MHDDCVNMVRKTIEALGGLDVIVSNAGWTIFTAFGDLHAMTEEDWDKVCPQSPLSFLIHTVDFGLDMWYGIVLGGKC